MVFLKDKSDCFSSLFKALYWFSTTHSAKSMYFIITGFLSHPGMCCLLLPRWFLSILLTSHQQPFTMVLCAEYLFFLNQTFIFINFSNETLSSPNRPYRIEVYTYFSIRLWAIWEYSHVLHKKVSVNNGPHIQSWSHTIIMELENSHLLVML